jgi:hypothetical protein
MPAPALLLPLVGGIAARVGVGMAARTAATTGARAVAGQAARHVGGSAFGRRATFEGGYQLGQMTANHIQARQQDQQAANNGVNPYDRRM